MPQPATLLNLVCFPLCSSSTYYLATDLSSPLTHFSCERMGQDPELGHMNPRLIIIANGTEKQKGFRKLRISSYLIHRI